MVLNLLFSENIFSHLYPSYTASDKRRGDLLRWSFIIGCFLCIFQAQCCHFGWPRRAVTIFLELSNQMADKDAVMTELRLTFLLLNIKCDKEGINVACIFLTLLPLVVCQLSLS